VTLSPNLTLPYILPAQAQKHITHNEALRALDVLVQLCVLDRDRTEPPAVPVEGDRHIVGEAAGSAWDGHDDEIAAWQDGAWSFRQPRVGWLCWSAADETLLVFDGAGWVPASLAGAPAMLGINATADATNRLTVSAAATLLNHEGAGHRLKLNKALPADTASLLFQTGFSGRAEMGTAGDDDFHFKVSPDGTVWHEAVVIDANSGAVTLPATPGRARLSGDRTYFVRPDGDDGNDGLADTAAGAFATVQHALDVAFGDIDLGPHNVTIRLGDGTYAQDLSVRGAQVGAGTITLAGNAAAPQDTILAGAGAGTATVSVENGATLYLRDFELRGNDALCLSISAATVRLRGGMRFGATGTGSTQLNVMDGGLLEAVGYAHAVTGDSARHVNAVDGGVVQFWQTDIELVGTRSFATAFATAFRGGTIRINSGTLTGTATGKRYRSEYNAIIFAGDAAGTRLPGDVAGETSTGGVYA